MKAHITEQDLDGLQAFPVERRAAILQAIQARRPAERAVLTGDNDFEKTILKLRREGYSLIDLQREDIAFTTLWYRKGKALLGRAGADVAMLVWEMQEPEVSTTVMSWRI